MSDKWTPGPWTYERGDDFQHSDDGPVNGFTVKMQQARLVIHRIRYAEEIYPEDTGHHEAEANARLIAVAPEMAELLASYVARMSGVDGSLKVEYRTGNMFEHHAAARALLARIGAPS